MRRPFEIVMHFLRGHRGAQTAVMGGMVAVLTMLSYHVVPADLIGGKDSSISASSTTTGCTKDSDCAMSGDVCNIATCNQASGACETAPNLGAACETERTFCSGGPGACHYNGGSKAECILPPAVVCSQLGIQANGNNTQPCIYQECDNDVKKCVDRQEQDGKACDVPWGYKGDTSDQKTYRTPGTCQIGVCIATPISVNPACPAGQGGVCHKSDGTWDTKTATCLYEVTKGADCTGASGSGNKCQSGKCSDYGVCEFTEKTCPPLSREEAVCKENVCDPTSGACKKVLKDPLPPACNKTHCTDLIECDDGNPCTEDSCADISYLSSDKDCVHTSKSDGTTTTQCQGGDVCTGVWSCQKGLCTKSDAVDCPAPEQCHVQAACTNGKCPAQSPVPDGVLCNDGNDLTPDDRCTGGTCIGGGYSCDDRDDCTADAFDAASRQCKHTRDPLCKFCGYFGMNNCDDGNACTTDSCVNRACINVGIEGCTKAEACTRNAQCDDGKPCTADLCEGGSCRNYALKNVPGCSDTPPKTIGDTVSHTVPAKDSFAAQHPGSPCKGNECELFVAGGVLNHCVQLDILPCVQDPDLPVHKAAMSESFLTDTTIVSEQQSTTPSTLFDVTHVAVDIAVPVIEVKPLELPLIRATERSDVPAEVCAQKNMIAVDNEKVFPYFDCVEGTVLHEATLQSSEASSALSAESSSSSSQTKLMRECPVMWSTLKQEMLFYGFKPRFICMPTDQRGSLLQRPECDSMMGYFPGTVMSCGNDDHPGICGLCQRREWDMAPADPPPSAPTEFAKTPACSTVVSLDPPYDNPYSSGRRAVGQDAAMVTPPDGKPFMTYLDAKSNALFSMKCMNPPTCTDMHQTLITYASGPSSITIGKDGLPVITSYGNNKLSVTKCENADCSQHSTITIDPPSAHGALPGRSMWTAQVAVPVDLGPRPPQEDKGAGWYNAVVTGKNGFPVIASYDAVSEQITVIICKNADCSDAEHLTVPAPIGPLPQKAQPLSLAILPDGSPALSFYKLPEKQVFVTTLGNSGFEGPHAITDEGAESGSEQSMAIGPDGFPIIVSFNAKEQRLEVIHCKNAACSEREVSILDGARAGASPKIVMGSDGKAVISYSDGTGHVRIATCSDPACAKGDIALAADGSRMGSTSALSLDKDGKPIIAFYDQLTATFKMAACNSKNCSCEAPPPPPVTGNAAQCNHCQDCGAGLWNICDMQECASLGDCLFTGLPYSATPVCRANPNVCR